MLSFLVTSGFLPALIFLLADAFMPKRLALWAALGGTAAALVLLAARQRGVDPAGLGSFALLAALAAASMRARDDFFFKIHGAVLSLLSAAAFLGAWIFAHKALLLEPPLRDELIEMVSGGSPGMSREAAAEVLRLTSMLLPWGMILHALAVFHAAANWGRWAWALARIPGFFLASAL